MPLIKSARIFRNGRSQAVRIPREMEFSTKDVLVHREGSRLIIEPVELPPTLESILSRLSPLEEAWPDIDAGLLPIEDVQL